MSFSRSYLAIAALAATAPAADANVAFNNAPKQTPAQAKHFTWVNEAGGLMCQPKGKLAQLVGDPYKCYINLDECGAAIDALKGKLDPGFQRRRTRSFSTRVPARTGRSSSSCWRSAASVTRATRSTARSLPRSSPGSVPTRSAPV